MVTLQYEFANAALKCYFVKTSSDRSYTWMVSVWYEFACDPLYFHFVKTSSDRSHTWMVFLQYELSDDSSNVHFVKTSSDRSHTWMVSLQYELAHAALYYWKTFFYTDFLYHLHVLKPGLMNLKYFKFCFWEKKLFKNWLSVFKWLIWVDPLSSNSRKLLNYFCYFNWSIIKVKAKE